MTGSAKEKIIIPMLHKIVKYKLLKSLFKKIKFFFLITVSPFLNKKSLIFHWHILVKK